MTNYNTTTLSNGLRIIHLPSTSPVVYCGIGINAGARQEGEGEEGVAHFCEHVTFKGTQRRSALQILNCLESVGGDLNAFTNKEDTIFYAAILKEHLSRAVDLLTDIVFNSEYPEQEIAHEVDVICDEIESYNDSPAELIYDEFENKLFSGHPLGHNILGTRERVKGFTSAHARRFTSRYYRPDNAIFFAYGDLNFSLLVRMLESRLKDVQVDNLVTNNDNTPITPVSQPSAMEIHHQAHVMLGSRTFGYNDERRLPLYSDTGCWSVYFGCDHHDVKRCIRLVHYELDRIMQHPLSERQLTTAKRQLKGQIVIACDNREQYTLDFAKNFLHYGRERNIDDLLQRIDAITAPQIQDVAQSVFAPSHMQTLIL